ncbi:predicted protein [Histoplasma capsulatum var. duboisii H88]|uniref:Predicted protein n=2 Tax=Ajellomyces capsulatus TaxID=5037 RepID=F0UVF7_AJEC8|nr:predicted protein [Histoplasma capsulatum H143]EGC49884.1 predicted protein [Histoplasma capsulatum var. duboisii H88]
MAIALHSVRETVAGEPVRSNGRSTPRHGNGFGGLGHDGHGEGEIGEERNAFDSRSLEELNCAGSSSHCGSTSVVVSTYTVVCELKVEDVVMAVGGDETGTGGRSLGNPTLKITEGGSRDLACPEFSSDFPPKTHIVIWPPALESGNG